MAIYLFQMEELQDNISVTKRKQQKYIDFNLY